MMRKGLILALTALVLAIPPAVAAGEVKDVGLEVRGMT